MRLLSHELKQSTKDFRVSEGHEVIFLHGPGAMNRIASAVGEGAMAIKLVNEYLSEL